MRWSVVQCSWQWWYMTFPLKFYEYSAEYSSKHFLPTLYMHVRNFRSFLSKRANDYRPTRTPHALLLFHAIFTRPLFVFWSIREWVVLFYAKLWKKNLCSYRRVFNYQFTIHFNRLKLTQRETNYFSVSLKSLPFAVGSRSPQRAEYHRRTFFGKFHSGIRQSSGLYRAQQDTLSFKTCRTTQRSK